MSHADVRYRDPVFERKCPNCLEWVELTTDGWRPENGLARCAACWRAYFAAKQRGYDREGAKREAKREAARVRYWSNREQHLAAQRSWRERNREHVAAYNRAYREAHKAKLREAHKAYYDDAREVILLKKRVRYHDERAA